MSADEASRHRANLASLWVCILIVAFSLWLRNGFPVHAVASANTDDFLFIRLAAAVRRAHWLGAYDNLTLAKGPFFPGFIAVNSLFHTPLKITEQAVYLAASAALALAVFRLTRSHVLGVLLFAVLAFNPVLWTESLARVIRDGLYISLALGLIAAFGLLWSQPLFGAFSRGGEILAGLFTGGLAAAFWLTREEGIWLGPALAVLGAGVLISLRAGTRVQFTRSTAMVFGVAAATIVTVASINFAVYRVFTDVEFRASGFLSAYGALNRVQHTSWQRYVVVPRDVREKVYGVSPAAAELRPHLEGASGDQWRRTGCTFQPAVPCTDILGGWFIWALRDAVALAGHSRSGGEAETFYTRLAGEIDAACDDGRLTCTGARASIAPPFRVEYLVDAVKVSPRFLETLLTFGQAEMVTLPNSGAPQRLATFRALVGPVESAPSTAPITRIFSWVAAAGEAPTLAVFDAQGNARGQVELTRAPDIDRVLPQQGFAAQLFAIHPECPALDCTVVLKLGDGSERRLPLKDFGGVLPEDPSFVMTIDDVERPVDGIAPEVAQRIALQQRIARAIAGGYAAAIWPLLVLGAAGTLAGLWVFRRTPRLFVLSTLAAAAFTAVASRIAMLSYLEVSTFPTLNTLYLSSAAPFVIVAAILGVWLGIHAMVQRRSA